jgi:hypothetical protein
MSLTDDLTAIADMAAAMAVEGDPARAIVALELLALIMPDLVERARLLEGGVVPPHWRRQPWDGQPAGNVTPLRRPGHA